MGKRYSGKAIAFTKPLHAEVHGDVLLPEMDENGVVLKTLYSGLSRGTELDLYSAQMHSRPPNTQWYPILPGYMPVGEVIEVGGRVEHLQVGDIALGSNLFSGFDERYCPAWAGHTEYVVMSAHSHPLGAGRAVKVPAGVDLKAASIALLAAIAYKGVSLKVKPEAGETVLVIGQGAIGNCAAQLSRAADARVIVADLCEYRLQQARLAGIGETINTSEVDLWEAVADLCGEGEPQKMIEVTGEPPLIEQCLLHAPGYGSVHAQGMYLEPIHVFIPATLFGRNLTFTGTVGEEPEMVEGVLAMMAEGTLKLDHLVTKVFDVDEATAAYKWAYEHPEECVTLTFAW